MKFRLITTILGAAGAVSLDKINPTDADDTTLLQEAQALEESCKDYDQYDPESLLAFDENAGDAEAEVDVDSSAGHIGGGHVTKTVHTSTTTTHGHSTSVTGHATHTTHTASSLKKMSSGAHFVHSFGKTKAAVAAENRAILSHMKQCLRFVKKHPGHRKICHWCKRKPTPAIRWKWVAAEHVWYRWYDHSWHYWGPSKAGFTAAGWRWYNGYWHHFGYVFKYVHHRWWRFEAHKWVEYGEHVPVDAEPPRSPPICRPFFRLRKRGLPASLAARKMEHCEVHAKNGKVEKYMWTGAAACRFLGGTRGYHRVVRCRDGQEHEWERVKKCVRGPIKESGGFDYGAFKRSKHNHTNHSNHTNHTLL